MTKLALALFDSSQNFHKLPPHDRELLEYASLLHDIGWHIGHSGHHKHSLYLIKNGDLEGFSLNELELIANIARYHRKSPPKKSHSDYTALAPADRETVWKLAGILRIADGLDRGHYDNVLSLHTIARRDTISIQITTKADAELELWAARHKTDMFETIFDRATKFTGQIAKRK